MKRGPPECSLHIPGLRVHLYARVEAFLRRVETGPSPASLSAAEADFAQWLTRDPKEGDCPTHGRYVGAVCPTVPARNRPGQTRIS